MNEKFNIFRAIIFTVITILVFTAIGTLFIQYKHELVISFYKAWAELAIRALSVVTLVVSFLLIISSLLGLFWCLWRMTFNIKRADKLPWVLQFQLTNVIFFPNYLNEVGERTWNEMLYWTKYLVLGGVTSVVAWFVFDKDWFIN
jgi:hypothetical protein